MTSRFFRSAALLVVVVAVPLFFSACGGGGDDNNPNPPPPPPPTPTPGTATSTITAAPTMVTANGSAAAAITVTLKDTDGNAYTGSADVDINADPCTNCTLDYSSDGSGTVEGTIKSTAAETITLSFSINGNASPNTAEVDFVAGPPDPDNSTIALSPVGASSAVAAVTNARGARGAGSNVLSDGVPHVAATVTLYDANMNQLTHGGDNVQISSTVGRVGRVVDNGDGTYTAEVASIFNGTGPFTFSVNHAHSSNITSVTYVSPPSIANTDYMAAWSVAQCKGNTCSANGIYETDVEDSSASVTQVVTGQLMGNLNVNFSIAVIDRAHYDTESNTIQNLGPAYVIYAKDGAVYKLDLMHPNATPTQLSSLDLTGLCNLSAANATNSHSSPRANLGSVFHTYVGTPLYIRISGFTDGSTQTDCQSGSPTTWFVSAGADASTAPLLESDVFPSGAYDVRGLVDPATGAHDGILVASGHDLELYAPNLQTHTTLATGILPTPDAPGTFPPTEAV